MRPPRALSGLFAILASYPAVPGPEAVPHTGDSAARDTSEGADTGVSPLGEPFWILKVDDEPVPHADVDGDGLADLLTDNDIFLGASLAGGGVFAATEDARQCRRVGGDAARRPPLILLRTQRVG